MNGNNITAISDDNALRAIQHSPDLVAPTVRSFSFDLNRGRLQISFSESVNVSSFDVTRITLQGRNSVTDSSLFYQLTGGQALRNDSRLSQGDAVVNIDLSVDDLNAIKALPEVASQTLNTYLSVLANAVQDMNGNDLTPVPRSAGIAGTISQADIVPPRLVNFTVDLSTETILLTFDESAFTSSLNATAITFQNSANSSLATSSYRLTGGTSQSAFGRNILLTLSRRDADNLKVLENLLTNSSNSFISITSSLITDMANLSVVEISTSQALQTVSVTPDTLQPSLTCFDLDLTSNILTLSFSESARVSTLNVTHLVLQSAPASTTMVRLTTSNSSSTNGPVLAVQLSFVDYNALRFLTNLATGPQDTYLSLSSGLVVDMSNNYVNQILATNATPVCSYQNDTSPPVLRSFDLRMTNGRLPMIVVLHFDEVVNVSTIDVTGITLYSGDSASASNYTLTNGTVLTALNSATVEIAVTNADLNAIKALAPMLQNASLSFASVARSIVQNMVQLGNSPSSILPVSVHTADLSTPVLTGFSLDLDADWLVLNFSEPVIPSTVNVELITLQSEMSQLSATAQHYTLTQSSRVANADMSTETATIYINISLADSNNVKSRELLATERNSTYISIARALVEDPANNPSGVIPTDSGLLADVYTVDTSRPRLLSFDVNIDTKTITLRFSETVNTSSLDTSQITVQNAAQQPTESYAFQQSLTVSPFGPTIELLVNRTDKNAIKQFENLFTSRNDSFISLTAQTLVDMAGNAIVAIPTNDALQATVHDFDQTPPYLVGWDIDLDSGILSLEFDETVNVTSLQTSQIVIQDATANATISYALRAAFTNDTSRALLRISLPSLDLDEVKRLRLCVASEINCYLSFASALVSDMVQLPVVAIPTDAAQRVRVRQPDITSPQLTEFVEFNLINNTMTLRFDETIDVAQLTITELTLQNFFEPPLLAYHQLRGGRSLSMDSTILVISISDADQAFIKANASLCVERGNCYLTATSSFIQDVSGRPVVPVVHGAPGRIVTRFIDDTQPPSLSSFDLDLEAGTVVLHFDEAVRASSLQPTAITFQLNTNDTSVFHRLTGGYTTSIDGRDITLSLSPADIQSLKSVDLGTSESRTYISFTDRLVADAAFRPNRVNAVPNDQAVNVTVYTPDTTAPVLQSFTLDQDGDWLRLTFSEPVRVSQTQATLLQLLGSMSASPYSITLNGGNVTSSNASNPGSEVITVHLTQQDLIALKLNSSLGTFTNNTYLTLASAAVTDMSAVDIGDTSASPMAASSVTLDTTAPRLTSFMFDEDFGRLNITFNDVVRAESFDARGLILQDGMTASSPTKRFVLTSSSYTSSPSGYILMVQMSDQDRFDLQRVGGVATNENNTYLTMRARTVDDHRYTDVIAITDGDGLAASAYIEDQRSPELLQFDFDLNTGMLHLHFSDNVRLSTFNVTQITVQAGRSLASTDVTLAGYSNVVRATNGTTLSVTLLDSDLNSVKNDTTFAISNSTVYLSLTSSTIDDMSGNPVVAINSSAARPVQTFTPDTTMPALVSWDLDMDSLTLTLTWSEIIDASSVRPAEFAIQGFANRTRHMTSVRQLTSQSTASQTDDIITQIYLGADDENAVKLLLDTATSDENAYLVLSSRAFVDKNMRMAQAISPQSGHLVRRHGFTPDTTRPRLLGFSFNRNLGNLSLTFTEVLLLESFNLTEVRLQHNYSLVPAISRVLTGGVASGPRGVLPIYDIALNTDDQNAVKRTDDLAINENNTFISLSAQTVVDRNNNPVVAVPSSNAAQVTEVIPDVTRPLLSSFEIDLDAGILDITFDEVVQAVTLQTPRIVLQNGPAFGGESVTLTDSSTVRIVNDVNLIINLSFSDLNNVKLARNLCTRHGDCNLNLTFDAVRDMSSNAILASAMAIPTSNLTVDLTRPRLISFNISLDAEIIYLEFDEAVDALTFNVWQLSLQSIADATSGAVQELTLTNSSTTLSPSGYLINVTLGFTDLNELKDLRNLASDSSNTYLRFTQQFIRDMNRNLVVAIERDSARSVSHYFFDQTSPALRQFNFDLNTGTMLLRFSETVDLATVDLTQMTLHSTSPVHQASENFTLTATSSATRPTVTNINVTLSLADLNRVKELDRLCVANASTCFISLTSRAINDTAGNRLSPVLITQAFPVYNYTSDTARPVLESFDLDLNLQEITFRFSETARASTLRITDVTLYEVNNDTSPSANQHSFAAGLTLSVDSANVTVRLGRADFDDITRKQLCRGTHNCFLAHSRLFVEDMNFNPVEETPISNLLQLSTFTVDAQRPIMVNFTHFDLDEGRLQLEFNETIRASTVNISALALQSFVTSGGTVRLSLADVQYSLNVIVILLPPCIPFSPHLVR